MNNSEISFHVSPVITCWRKYRTRRIRRPTPAGKIRRWDGRLYCRYTYLYIMDISFGRTCRNKSDFPRSSCSSLFLSIEPPTQPRNMCRRSTRNPQCIGTHNRWVWLVVLFHLQRIYYSLLIFHRFIDSIVYHISIYINIYIYNWNRAHKESSIVSIEFDRQRKKVRDVQH